MALTNLHITTSTNKNGNLVLDIPTNLKNTKVEVTVNIHKLSKDKKTKKIYDFSGLIGKLKWKGDAVRVQRELRNEWE